MSDVINGKLASRVSKTRDPIRTPTFKTRFARFVNTLTWTNFAGGRNLNT